MKTPQELTEEVREIFYNFNEQEQDLKCNQKVLRLRNTIISVLTQNNLMCPHCENVEMVEHVKNDTHIWVCAECPNVMLEFSTNKNIEDLKEFLNR